MRVAIYARVSTEKQEEEETVQSQLRLLNDYVKDRNFSVVNEYIDNGWSGATLARPNLDLLRDDASKKLFDAVVVTCPDRLARKQLYQGLITEELKKFEVKVLFINMGENEETPENNLLVGMQGLIAEYEKTKILERTRRGKIHKAKNGFVVGSIPPYGYRYVKKTDDQKGYYEVLENEAEVVKSIFSMVVDDSLSLRGVVKELLKQKINTRGDNEIWSRSTVSRIIKNESYTGTTYYNKYYCTETVSNNRYRRRTNTGRRLRAKSEWIPISIPPIIDKDKYEKAQASIINNSSFSKRNTKNEYLLKGLIYCDECGEKYYGTPCHEKTYYRCGNRLKRFPLPRDCSNKTFQSKKIDDQIWNILIKTINQPNIIENNVNKYFDVRKNADKQKEAEAKIHQKIRKLKNEEEKWLLAYREDVIGVEPLKERLTVVSNSIDLLNTELENLKNKSKLTKNEVKKDAVNMIKEVKKMLLDEVISFETKQKIVRLMVERIEIGRENINITGRYPLKVTLST